jgi:hypothetical protein
MYAVLAPRYFARSTLPGDGRAFDLSLAGDPADARATSGRRLLHALAACGRAEFD